MSKDLCLDDATKIIPIMVSNIASTYRTFAKCAWCKDFFRQGLSSTKFHLVDGFLYVTLFYYNLEFSRKN